MLQKLHDRSSSWFSWVVIILVVVVFALFGLSRFMGGGRGSNDVATVNGKSITMEEAQQTYNALRLRAKQEKVFKPTQAFEKQLKSFAMQALIRNAALSQDAKGQGYALSPLITQSLIESIPAFQSKGQFSEQRFQAFLASNPYAQHILTNLQTEALLNQVRIGYVASEFSLPYEQKQGIELIAQKRKVNTVSIPLAMFTASKIKISKVQIQKYYNAHQAQYTVPKQIQLSYVVLSIPEIMKTIKPTEGTLKQYYQANIERYQRPAQYRLGEIVLNLPTDRASAAAVLKKANKIEADLQKGESFKKLVDEYSQDKISKSKDGLLPWAHKSEMGPVLKKAVTELKKVGDVSKPIEGNGKVTIYKLVKYRKPSHKTFDQAKAEVTKAYTQQQAQTQFNNESEQFANVSYSQPGSLDPVAKALNLKIHTTPYFSRQGEKTGILSNPDVLSAAFGHDVLVNKNNSDVIDVGNDEQIVLRVNHVKPKSVKPLTKVAPQIKSLLVDKEKQKDAMALASNLKSKIKKGASLKVLAKQKGLTYKSLGYIDRRQAKVNPAIIQAAFKNRQALNIATVNGKGLALVQVTAKKAGSFKNAAERKAFGQQYASSLGQVEYGLYAKAVVKAAKVKIKNKSWAP